jgi:hypothetical protein
MSNSAGRRAGPVVARAAIALVLLGAGLLLRQGADVAARLAAALERQTTTPVNVAPELDEVEQAAATLARIPYVGPRVERDIAHRRAEASYWAGDYTSLTQGIGDPAADAAADPQLAALRANAMFRTVQGRRADTATLVRDLDDVLQRFAEVLKQDPSLADVAHNYEVVVRVREAVSRGRLTNIQPEQQTDAQGERGAPPDESTPADFNVIVPMRPDERQDQLDAGSGSVPIRKG